MTDEGSAFFDDDAHGFEIAEKFRIRFQFATFLDSDIAIDRAVNRYRFRANFPFNNSIFSKCQNSFRKDLAFHFAVNGDRIIHVNVTPGAPVRVGEGARVELSYSVDWEETDVPFGRRFETYLDASFFEHQIHW